MANYRPPSDPRPSAPRERAPWGWLAMGFLITAVSLFAALWFVSEMLTRPPVEVANEPVATIIRLTAPPTIPPTATSVAPTPTPIPTFAPSPTPDLKIAPAELTVGFFAQVEGTDGVGLTVRDASSTVGASLLIAAEDTSFLILDGPVENNNFRWWQIQLADGTVGWAADLYMVPVSQPVDWPNP